MSVHLYTFALPDAAAHAHAHQQLVTGLASAHSPSIISSNFSPICFARSVVLHSFCLQMWSFGVVRGQRMHSWNANVRARASASVIGAAAVAAFSLLRCFSRCPFCTPLRFCCFR